MASLRFRGSGSKSLLRTNTMSLSARGVGPRVVSSGMANGRYASTGATKLGGNRVPQRNPAAK